MCVLNKSKYFLTKGRNRRLFLNNRVHFSIFLFQAQGIGEDIIDEVSNGIIIITDYDLSLNGSTNSHYFIWVYIFKESFPSKIFTEHALNFRNPAGPPNHQNGIN